MAFDQETFAGRALRRLANGIYRYPRFFFYPSIVLFILSIFYTVQYLEFNTDRNSLVGADQKYHGNFLRFRAEFPAQDDLVVVVESEDKEKNRQFVERLGRRLEKEPLVFQDVFYKGTLTQMGPKALLFVPESDLAEMRQALREYRPFIQNFTRANNLVTLIDLINTQFRTAPREATPENEAMVKALPALDRIIKLATDSLKRPGFPPSPGVTALFDSGGQAETQMYITFAAGKVYLVTVRPKDVKQIREVIARLKNLIAETHQEVPGINAGLTGELVLEQDEMVQSQIDSTMASVVSLLVCAFIFIYAYRETGRPLKATACLIIGLGYTMAFTTMAVGHLNILTITFVPILIGLAIDFGIHLITRYEEELRRGLAERTAIRKALVFTGQGIFTGALTTAGAFLAMTATDFDGIQEMGIICGGGMLICLIPMLTLLPVLLLRGRQNIIDHRHVRTDRRARLEQWWLERPWLVIGISAILCAVGATQIPRIRFDYNLLNMQSQGLPAVEFQNKLLHSANKSLLFGAVVAETLPEAQQLEEKILQLPTVATVESMTRFLGEDQSRKLRLVRQIKEDVSSIQFAQTDAQPVDLAELSQTLFSLQGYLGLIADEVEKDDTRLAQELRTMMDSTLELRKEIQKGNPEAVAQKLARFQQVFFADVQDTFKAIQQQESDTGLKVGDLPVSLRNRFIGKTGKLLIQVYPKGNVWERAEQEKFVTELQSVAPEATGTPVQLYYYTSLLKTSFQNAAWYSLAAVLLMVAFHFRNFWYAILSLIPVGIGLLWLIGFMGIAGIPFNPANIMTFPLVIGIGITNGIHILNRFMEERTPSILSKSTGKAIIVSGLTTIAGFGSLILAKHQGIASLGYVMAFGVATCMIAAVTFLPAMLNVTLGRRTKKETQR